MTQEGIRDADVDLALCVRRESVRTGERSEVVIEGPVLLHDEDEVIDLVQTRGHRRSSRPGPAVRAGEVSGYDQDERYRDAYRDHRDPAS
jgi:hypothetical protein